MFKNVFMDSSWCGLGLRGGGFWEYFLLLSRVNLRGTIFSVYILTDLILAKLE